MSLFSLLIGFALVGVGLYIAVKLESVVARLLALIPLLGGAMVFFAALPWGLPHEVRASLLILMFIIVGGLITSQKGLPSTAIGLMIVIIGLFALINVIGTDSAGIIGRAISSAIDVLGSIIHDANEGYKDINR